MCLVKLFHLSSFSSNPPWDLEWRGCGIHSLEPVEQRKEQELLCFWGTSEPISARTIRESCGNLNLRADLYLPVVLLLLTSRGNKSAVLQADRLRGGRSPFSPFFYELGKICHWLQDWRSSTPRQSSGFSQNYKSIISHTSTSQKSLSTKLFSSYTPAQPLKYSLWAWSLMIPDPTGLLDSVKTVSDFLGIFIMKKWKTQIQTCMLNAEELHAFIAADFSSFFSASVSMRNTVLSVGHTSQNHSNKLR